MEAGGANAAPSPEQRRQAAAAAAAARGRTQSATTEARSQNAATTPEAQEATQPSVLAAEQVGSTARRSCTQDEDKKIEEVAREFNRELGLVGDYLHQHPQHVLDAVKLIHQIVSDLNRHGGSKPNDSTQPVRYHLRVARHVACVPPHAGFIAQ